MNLLRILLFTSAALFRLRTVLVLVLVLSSFVRPLLRRFKVMFLRLGTCVDDVDDVDDVVVLVLMLLFVVVVCLTLLILLCAGQVLCYCMLCYAMLGWYNTIRYYITVIVYVKLFRGKKIR